MLKSVKAIGLLSLLLCMTLFISVGYAAFSDSMQIDGTAEYREIEAVYIKNIRLTSSSNVTGTPIVTKVGHLFFQCRDCSLNKQTGSGTSNAGGSISIEITVKNNSGVDQYFLEHKVNPALPSSCRSICSGIETNYLLKNGDEKTFTVTIQNTSTSVACNLDGYESELCFAPNFDESFTADATESVAQIFASVLAGTGIDGKGTGITFNGEEVAAGDIMAAIDDNMSGKNWGSGGYIGNVDGASPDQKELIDAIFGEEIIMPIGNQHYSVSLMIKYLQANDQGKDDIVIYVTADQLKIGGSSSARNNVPVYGIVFINNGDDTYTECEHLFAGEAPVSNMSGSFGTNYTGSFNTDHWVSTEYNVSDEDAGLLGWGRNGELDEAYVYYDNNK